MGVPSPALFAPPPACWVIVNCPPQSHSHLLRQAGQVATWQAPHFPYFAKLLFNSISRSLQCVTVTDRCTPRGTVSLPRERPKGRQRPPPAPTAAPAPPAGGGLLPPTPAPPPAAAVTTPTAQGRAYAEGPPPPQ